MDGVHGPRNMDGLQLGVIGDDFTGAADAASFLHLGGLDTILLNGVQEGLTLPAGCRAAVIGLKSRSAPAEQAVSDSLDAARWLTSRS